MSRTIAVKDRVLAVMAAGGVIAVLFGSASAFADGYPVEDASCTKYAPGSSALEFIPVKTGSKSDGMLSVNVRVYPLEIDPAEHPGDQIDSPVADFEATGQNVKVTAVLVQGGPETDSLTNVYLYPAGTAAESGVHAPLVLSGGAVSPTDKKKFGYPTRISFCYVTDVSSPTPSPRPTDSPTADPTVTTEPTPTDDPTGPVPTDSPTVTADPTPTSEPSDPVPTDSPTVTADPTPTEDPTGPVPTGEPTVTVDPSDRPAPEVPTVIDAGAGGSGGEVAADEGKFVSLGLPLVGAGVFAAAIAVFVLVRRRGKHAL